MELPDRLFAAAVFREEARRQGFVRIGFARVEEPQRFDRFRGWIEQGRHAGMHYLERTADLRARPQDLLPGARSIVCLAVRHETRPLVAADGARIARYVAGSAGDSSDYHWSLRRRAEAVAESAAGRLGRAPRFRVCVDSTPLAERSFAAAAGLGWIGKNGCLIDADLGSFLLLVEILTDLDLPPDEPAAERCGSCVRCLEACPTAAFVEPGLLDARRCLAYWTIEHRGAIPDEIKGHVGEHVFGCDICQEVCPWNGPISAAEAGPIRKGSAKGFASLPTRSEWLSMGRGQWRRDWGATAMNRAGWRAIQRNAAIGAGAVLDHGCAPLLGQAAGCGDVGLVDGARWAAKTLER